MFPLLQSGGFLMPVYKRILIKISGEALAGESGFGLSDDSIPIWSNR